MAYIHNTERDRERENGMVECGPHPLVIFVGFSSKMDGKWVFLWKERKKGRKKEW